MTVQRALVIGAGGDVGKATVAALTDAGIQVLGAGHDRDATDPAQVGGLLADADPDLVVVAAGARPWMAPVAEHTWESFSATWNADVRIAFEVGRAVLARPLRPGSTVIILSSGAALGGSPLSGGYAGAKRMQMFLATYLQQSADRAGLGIRFVALVPRQLVAGTAIGRAAAEAYGAEAGEPADVYLKRFPVPLDAAGVARAVVDIATGEQHGEATAVAVTGSGIQAL